MVGRAATTTWRMGVGRHRIWRKGVGSRPYAATGWRCRAGAGCGQGVPFQRMQGHTSEAKVSRRS